MAAVAAGASYFIKKWLDEKDEELDDLDLEEDDFPLEEEEEDAREYVTLDIEDDEIGQEPETVPEEAEPEEETDPEEAESASAD